MIFRPEEGQWPWKFACHRHYYSPRTSISIFTRGCRFGGQSLLLRPEKAHRIARTRWLYHLIDWHDQVLRPGGVGESSLQCLTWCPFSGVVTSSSTELTDRSQSFIKYRWAFSAWRWWTWLRRTGDRTHIFNDYFHLVLLRGRLFVRVRSICGCAILLLPR